MYSKAKKRLTDNRLDETFYRKYCEKVPYSYVKALFFITFASHIEHVFVIIL